MSFKDFINEKEAYQKFFDKMLKKYGVDSPEDLSDEDKKKFFDEVDRGWKGDEELDEAANKLSIKKGKGSGLIVQKVKAGSAFTAMDDGQMAVIELDKKETDQVHQFLMGNMSEAYASIGYTQTADKIYRLSKILRPGSALEKNISKNADNVSKEFKEMSKHIKAIVELWEEVEYIIGMNESVKLDKKETEEVHQFLMGNMSEAYAKSAGYKAVSDRIYFLSEYLRVGSNLEKNISKEVGDAKKQFKKMGNNIEEIVELWEELGYELEMSESVELDEAIPGPVFDDLAQAHKLIKNAMTVLSKDKTYKEHAKMLDRAKDILNAIARSELK